MTASETSTFVKRMAAPGKRLHENLFNILIYLDEKIRDRAVKAVEKFLSLQGDSMGYEEFMKLWKGFFYCFWLSDKTDGQHKLAEVISKFIHQLPVDNKSNPSDSSAFLFVRAFWETMGREWPSLDHLRLNKYYYFMGRILFETLNFIASKHENGSEWSVDLVKAQGSILSSTVFDFKNLAFPMSIRAYVMENYFSILKSVREEGFSAEMSVLVCEPIISAVAYCDNKTFFSQFSEALIQGLLPQGDSEDDFEDEEHDNESDENADGQEHEMEFEENSEVESEVEFDEKDALEVISDNEEEYQDEEEVSNEEDGDFDEIDSEDDEIVSEEDGIESDDGSSSHAEYSPTLFDYSKLGKFIFDYGSCEDILVRNRRFLFDLSKIIDEINSGEIDCCGNGDYCTSEEATH